MATFGFRKQKKQDFFTRINGPFLALGMICFLLFSVITSMQRSVFAQPSQTLLDEDLGELALYISTYDSRASSVILSIQRIAQGYNNANFLQTYQGDIENVLQYLSNNPKAFAQLGLQQYKPFLDFLAGLSTHKSDIWSLLGKEKPQTYIIALQNASERRPNGGFFGSFAKVTISDAKITDMQFIDSYVPGTIRPDLYLEAPERSNTFLGDDNKITFLASNKFGFTDIDGKNIKKLYDLTYKDDIRGVIFINSEMFADLLAGFEEMQWEWQFQNASIDLIRGQALPNKKELYFNGVQEFLKAHQTDLIKSIAKHFDIIQKNRYVQAYFVRTSPEFMTFLQDQSLETVFSPNTLYLWDYNSSYNKIDGFVTKTTSIFDVNGKLALESNQDVIDISKLMPGKYTMDIQYFLNIPQRYTSQIQGLAKEFNIQLNLREKHILALFPEWSSRGVVYGPQNVTFSKPTGPIKTSSTFSSPFSTNAFYVVENTVNNSMKSVTIEFEVR